MADDAEPLYDSYYYGGPVEGIDGPIEEVPAHAESTGSIARSAVLDVEQELQTLRFYKDENENALRQAIQRSRQYKSKGGKYSWAAESVRERQQWLQRVVEEEQHKPLEVTAEFVKSFQERERQEALRWRQTQVRREQALRKIQDTERRKEEIRQLWREKASLQRSVAAATGAGELVPPGADPYAFPGLEGGEGGRGIEAADGEGGEGGDDADAKAKSAMGKVYANLARLMELEDRIAELEREHLGMQPKARPHAAGGGAGGGGPGAYSAGGATGAGKVGAAPVTPSTYIPDPFANSIPTHSDANPYPVVTETPAVPGQQRLVFVKKRTEATLTQPSRVYYVVRIRQADESTATLQQPAAATAGDEVPQPVEPGDRDYAYAAGLEEREGMVPPATAGSRAGTTERRRPGRSAGSSRSGAAGSASGGPGPWSAEDREPSAWEQARAEREEKARRKAERAAAEAERAERVDDMIEQWLAERQSKEQHRRKFLEQRKQRERDWVAALDTRKRALDAILQRNAPQSSEMDGYAGGHGHGGHSRDGRRSAGSGGGSPSQPGSRSAGSAGGPASSDDVGLQLSLLDQQQKSIEKWRPVLGPGQKR
eukprot:tig00021435_g21420.t1